MRRRGAPISWGLDEGRPAEAIRHFRDTWTLRFAELTGRRGWAPWDEGYGAGGPDTAGYLFEYVVRCAELLGVGLLVTLLDDFAHGPRTRAAAVALGEEGTAFAKTCVTPAVLAKALLDVESAVAARMGVTFVLGRVVKANGAPTGSILLHELVHVEQFYRWGWAYVAKALWSQHRGAGYAYAVGTPHAELNAEQEAAFVEDEARQAAGLPLRFGYVPQTRLPH